MPRTTYGVLQGMISHRITSPDPGALAERDDMPDACTLCHVDRDRVWASESMAALGLRGSPPEALAANTSRVERDLVGGDPIQRVLAAHALARPNAVGDVDRRLRALVDALEDDYPAVRWFAHRGWVDLAPAELQPALQGFDAMADPAERIAIVDALRARVGPSRVYSDRELWHALLGRRDDVAIAIGE